MHAWLLWNFSSVDVLKKVAFALSQVKCPIVYSQSLSWSVALSDSKYFCFHQNVMLVHCRVNPIMALNLLVSCDTPGWRKAQCLAHNIMMPGSKLDSLIQSLACELVARICYMWSSLNKAVTYWFDKQGRTSFSCSVSQMFSRSVVQSFSRSVSQSVTYSITKLIPLKYLLTIRLAVNINFT